MVQYPRIFQSVVLEFQFIVIVIYICIKVEIRSLKKRACSYVENDKYHRVKIFACSQAIRALRNTNENGRANAQQQDAAVMSPTASTTWRDEASNLAAAEVDRLRCTLAELETRLEDAENRLSLATSDAEATRFALADRTDE